MKRQCRIEGCGNPPERQVVLADSPSGAVLISVCRACWTTANHNPSP